MIKSLFIAFSIIFPQIGQILIFSKINPSTTERLLLSNNVNHRQAMIEKKKKNFQELH